MSLGAQDNGHLEFCNENYVCYYVYESKVLNCINCIANNRVLGVSTRKGMRGNFG